MKAGTYSAGCMLEQTVAFHECFGFNEGIANIVRLITNLSTNILRHELLNWLLISYVAIIYHR